METSAKKREPQQDRSRDTRQRILAAAAQALFAKGYSGATTLEIQQLAGVTRGALLYHYRSRDELLIAAVRHLAGARIQSMPLDRAWPDDPRERIGAAIDVMWSSFDSDYFWASTELWLAARHNPVLAEVLEPSERDLARIISGAVAAFFGHQMASHPQFDDVVDFLQSSMRGAGLTYALGGRVRPRGTEPLLKVWRAFAESVLLRGGNPEPGTSAGKF